MITKWLRDRAAALPRHAAVIWNRDQLSFAELDHAVDATARHLLADGLHAGDRVGLLCPPGLDFVRLTHAIPRAGGVLIPLSPSLTPAELETRVVAAGCGVLLHDPGSTEAASRLRDAVPRVIALPPGSSAMTTSPPVGARPVAPSAPHSIVFTSGTSGRPRPVMLTHGNHQASAAACAERLGLNSADRWLACMPLDHVGGLAILLRSVMVGLTVVLQRGFDVELVDTALDQERITVVSLVPTMLQRLLRHRHPRPFPSHLRCLLLGGAPLPADLVDRCRQQGLPLTQTWGLTEAASMVTCQRPGEGGASAGRPVAGSRLRILDIDGTDLPRGEIGEIAIQGPTVSPGGFDPATECVSNDYRRWLRTGDLGRLTASGRLQVIGRRDDLIISGGANVDPAEVEAVLLESPGVAEACVVGLPHREWGEIVAAAIVPRSGATPDLAQIEEICRHRLSGAKAPRVLRVVDALPRTEAGKLRRRELRDCWPDGGL